MIRRGGAWVYKRYSDDAALLRLKREAQVQRRGLWSLPEAERIPPWEWRAAQRKHREPISPAAR
jgi:endonuclease YncB( thermonuclease family)